MTHDDDDRMSFDGVLRNADLCIRETGGEWDDAISYARKLEGLHGKETVRQIIEIINLRNKEHMAGRRAVQKIVSSGHLGSYQFYELEDGSHVVKMNEAVLSVQPSFEAMRRWVREDQRKMDALL